jgi:hypothetical protein
MSTQFEEAEVSSYTPNSGPEVMDDVRSRSAVRWFFNPAAKINVRDRIVGDEVGPDGQIVPLTFIKAGTLVPLRNKTYNTPRPNDQPPPPGARPGQQRLVAHTKYAADIASELEFAYADTGSTIVASLTGIEDEALVRSIFRLCVGAQIKVATDPLLPGEKIPVLPEMLYQLQVEAPQRIEQAFADQDDPKLRNIIEQTRTYLIAACESAMTNWRTVAEDSRLGVAERAGTGKGKINYDARDRRAFASMGESVPTNIQPTNVKLEQAVELLLNKELNKKPAQEDPRIAKLEKAIKSLEQRLEKASSAGS